MKKPQAIQISIPQPCSEDWQKMTPQDQGRYCNACKKCVIDFTGFTDRQLYDYYTQHANEKICGRFHNAQLNRPITIPAQPHSKLYRIAIALGLAIAIVTTTEQQSFAKAPRIEYNFTNNYHTDDTTQNNTDSTYATIKGQVLYKKKKPLANAVVKLLSGSVVKAGIVTDENGNYILKLVPAGTYTLTVMYMGYKDETVEQITISEGQTLIQNITMTTLSNIDIYRTGGPMFNNVSIDIYTPGNKTITSDQIKHTAH